MRNRAISIPALTVVLAMALGPTLLSAGEKQQDCQEIVQDNRQLEAGRNRLEQLTHAIDLWHDANLKGDQSQIDRCSQQLQSILQRDMDATALAISRARVEKAGSVREFHQGNRHWSEKAADRADLKDDRRDVDQLRETLKAKKRLSVAISKSPAFSNKFRLLGDYMDVMRLEMGMTRLELAEDVRELHEDQ